nr:MAG TPA: hypothetical protein [Caudoviricetes sp.]
MKQDLYVYFLYSDQQLQERKTIEKSISKSFVPGSVIVNGRKKMFTELSTKPTNRYADCKVVAEGYKSTMNYTLPSI